MTFEDSYYRIISNVFDEYIDISLKGVDQKVRELFIDKVSGDEIWSLPYLIRPLDDHHYFIDCFIGDIFAHSHLFQVAINLLLIN